MAKVGRMVKEVSVEEVASALAEQPNFFITTINRLTAPDSDLLRLKLHASKARLVMIKRRLGQRAMTGFNMPGLADRLEGSVGFVITQDDVLQVAKVLTDFRKTREEQLFVRGALIEGQLLDEARVQELAQLPSKPVLLAQVLATIEAPLADVIFTLERLIGDIAFAVEQLAEKKPKTDATEQGASASATPAPAAASPDTPPMAGGQEPANLNSPTNEIS